MSNQLIPVRIYCNCNKVVRPYYHGENRYGINIQWECDCAYPHVIPLTLALNHRPYLYGGHRTL